MKKIFLPIFLLQFTFKLLAVAYLSNIFQDNMILQREKPLKIWGSGDVGDKVTLRIEDQEDSTIVSTEGKWNIILAPLYTSKEPIIFEFESDENIQRFENVLVGDIWFCSGQSNMALTVNYSENADEEIQNSKNLDIRLFTVPQSYNTGQSESQDIAGYWELCEPENVIDFSATAYFFGKELDAELDIPIGLINSSYGSSMIESWTSIEGNIYVEGGDQYIEDVYNGQYPDLEEENYPSALFNTMIFPFANFSIKGFIWYQGERNTRTDEACYKYRFQLPALINDWRNVWNENELPFYFVQLPNFNIEYNWALIRESMEVAATNTANTEIAITIDIGESDNIHPANKQDVGKRLALLALNNTYHKDIIFSGPKYKNNSVNNSRIIIEFENIYEGFKASGDIITGFEISENNKIFYDADTYISGNNIVVNSIYVSKPVAVRYCWSSDPKCNLYNSAELPLRPFKTNINNYNLPSEVQLYQNYPNPFNPITTISFLNKFPENINLSVYNAMGEKITTLIDNNLNAGFHEVKFDGMKLQSGVYFYTLLSENNKLTKKMVITK
ncbi:MAG: T9SS type A sorting domain-containing protein [Candidatus Delongbacteria bacterium]|nr:T9SS type A sorting domain-containing protein [Candidatus Delongbacteria bacterium]